MVHQCLIHNAPIIDIEHMQLFSTVSICELFKRSGFIEISTAPFINRYSLDYWIRLAPLPKVLKRTLKWIGIRTGMGRLKVGVNVGNTITAGFRPNNE